MCWRAVLALGLLAVMVSTAPVRAYTRVHSGLGFGLTRDRVDVEDGDTFDANGFFGTYNGYLDGGFMFRFSISETHRRSSGTQNFGFGPLTGTVQDHFLRMDLSAGYLFRRREVVRPFVHAGVSRVSVEDVLANVQLVHNDSMVPTYGAGIELGKWHHAVYADLNFDRRHGIDANFDLGTVRFTLRQIQLGYLYSF